MHFEEPPIPPACGLDTSFGITNSNTRSNSPLSGNLAISSPTWETCITPWWLLSRWIMWLLRALFDWTVITQIMHYPEPLLERNLLFFPRAVKERPRHLKWHHHADSPLLRVSEKQLLGWIKYSKGKSPWQLFQLFRAGANCSSSSYKRVDEAMPKM